MIYQITITPSTIPCFESKSEFFTRVKAKLLSIQHCFKVVNIWSNTEKKENPNGLWINPTKLIGVWYFGENKNVDWRR